MSLNINRDPVPATKKEWAITSLVAVICFALMFPLSQVSYPLAILTGIPSFFSFYLLFCYLLVLFKDEPNSPHSEIKDNQREKVNHLLPIFLIGLPSVCAILALIILACYN